MSTSKQKKLHIRKLGVRSDQPHMHGVVYAAGWFDKDGCLLGHGVLREEDFLRIARKLMGNEFFIILPRGEACKGNDYRDKVDFSYLVNNAQYVIGSKRIYKIDRWKKHTDGEEVPEFRQAQYISKKHLAELLTKQK